MYNQHVLRKTAALRTASGSVQDSLRMPMAASYTRWGTGGLISSRNVPRWNADASVSTLLPLVATAHVGTSRWYCAGKERRVKEECQSGHSEVEVRCAVRCSIGLEGGEKAISAMCAGVCAFEVVRARMLPAVYGRHVASMGQSRGKRNCRRIAPAPMPPSHLLPNPALACCCPFITQKSSYLFRGTRKLV